MAKTKKKAKKKAAKQRAIKKSDKTRQPSVKQTDRDASGRFVKGNKTGKRFESGESGNPNGPPKRKTQLWVWLCKYMDMTDTEFKKLDRTKLTQAKQYALNLVENMKTGKGPESERFARHIFDREEGKAVEHFIIGNDDTLTDNDCDEVREELLKNHAD